MNLIASNSWSWNHSRRCLSHGSGSGSAARDKAGDSASAMAQQQNAEDFLMKVRKMYFKGS